MQILYGGIQIALERPQGTDGVLGFQVPKGTQNVQWIEALRGADAYPVARGNRKRTVTGSIFPAPLATLDAAMLAREQFYELLPLSGPLVLAEGTTITTFAQAVLQDIDMVEEVTAGVSFGLKFIFVTGAPKFSISGGNLVTSTGKLLVTSTGLVIRA